MVTKTKCLICDERPAVIGFYCRYCSNQLKAEKQKRRQSRRKITPSRYITYQDKVIAMIDLGKGMGRYTPSDVQPAKLPKAKTIDLNLFCPQLTKEEVKRLKRLVISLTRERMPVGGSYEKCKA